MVPADLLYSEEHVWVQIEGKNLKIGMTEYAQAELGDVVFVDLPAVGQRVTEKTPMASIESVKAISDLIAPVTGEVVEVNDDLQHSPEMINQDPYGKGWVAVIELTETSGVNSLLSAEKYTRFSKW